MYSFKNFSIAALVLLGCSSCHIPAQSPTEVIAIDSLLDAQTTALVGIKATLKKEVWMDGKEEKKILHLQDSTSWAGELDVFKTLQVVNSPVYRDRLNIEYDLPDVNSNLRILSVTSDGDLPVTELKVYYQNTPETIRKIEGTYRTESSMFTATRQMLLEFQDYRGTLLLSRYRVEGSQKMILGDSVKYRLEGEIGFQ